VLVESGNVLSSTLNFLTVFQYFHSFYEHGSKIVQRCYLMFQICIDIYWGTSLSNIALNVRKSHINHVKFLHATFASLSLRKKEAFFILHIFSIHAPICDNNHFSVYCTISHRGSPEIFHRSNCGIRTTFPSHPLSFSPFFTHIEY